MNPVTLEWIQKAEGDFISAGREFRARKLPNYDAACFHSQQCAEKYLKAILQEAGLVIPKTHNLADLYGLCIKSSPSLEAIQSELNILEGYAVQFRYPGISALREEAKTALFASKTVRALCRRILNLAD
jgi:HEPN domain-containing protein